MSDPIEADTPKTTTPHDGPLSLAAIELRIADLSTATSLDLLMQTREALAFMKGQIKIQELKLEAVLMEWIEANGPIQIGSRRIFIGKKKDTKIVELRPAIEALLNCCDGDFSVFCECLASNAIKYGAAKSVMPPDVWAKHFKVVEKSELNEKGEAAPIREVVDVDETFMKEQVNAKRRSCPVESRR